MNAKDFKHTAARTAKAPAPPGSWVSFISGLGLGLLVALGVYLWAVEQANVALESAPAQAGEAPVSDRLPTTDLDTKDLLESPRPKFDFYKILPEMEVPVQEWELAEGEPEPAAPPAAGGAYVLQVGSFKSFEDADQAKAKLALQGITATIQRVVINGQDVWFRVHVGPFSNSDEMRATRLKLIESDTDFIVLRIGGNGAT